MLRLALAALLLPFALAGCESTPEPDDLASRLDARYAEGLGTLESFHVYAAGTSLYYIGAEDSTGARTFELTPDPDAVARLRAEGLRAWATADAGPNVCVICPPEDTAVVAERIGALAEVVVARPGPGSASREPAA